jgi:hypothetical protein
MEAGTGVALALSPSLVPQIVFGTALDGAAAPVVARLAGAALLAIGVACWLARDEASGRATRGLLAALLLHKRRRRDSAGACGRGVGTVRHRPLAGHRNPRRDGGLVCPLHESETLAGTLFHRVDDFLSRFHRACRMALIVMWERICSARAVAG